MIFSESTAHLKEGQTLFLDRDGVINIESVGSYITNWEDFIFHDGVLEALELLSPLFAKIIVVSNQRGVGKGIMTLENLKEINVNLQKTVQLHGGRLDKIYNCTATDDNDKNRKPNTGMGLQAKEDFPEIDFRKSVMVGNSISDMEFGKRLQMKTVLLTTKIDAVELPHPLIDAQYPSLLEWTKNVVTNILEQQLF
jgi:D-glycero-D-manno-heptose 1,7-bisphosphate phosphatase